jgi:hypothetical protein
MSIIKHNYNFNDYFVKLGLELCLKKQNKKSYMRAFGRPMGHSGKPIFSTGKYEPDKKVWMLI